MLLLFALRCGFGVSFVFVCLFVFGFVNGFRLLRVVVWVIMGLRTCLGLGLVIAVCYYFVDMLVWVALCWIYCCVGYGIALLGV